MSDIRRLLDRLPAKQREAVELVVWSECSIAEAARALGVPEGTVKSRLSRARTRLAGLLDLGTTKGLDDQKIPAERPLPNKTTILDHLLAETDEKRGRRSWLLPVTAAASIAVVAAGALTVPSLLKHDDPGAAGQSVGASKAATNKPTEQTVSIDRGKLTDAQAKAFGIECAKWIGSRTFPGRPPERRH